MGERHRDPVVHHQRGARRRRAREERSIDEGRARPDGGSRLGRAALALVAGGLVGCSLPPFGPWFLAPIGLGVAAWPSGAAVGRRLSTGFLVGLGQFTIGCVWASSSPGLGYAVLVAFESLFVAVALAAVPPGRGRLVAFAGSLTILEWARDHWPFGGLPIGSAAIGQAGGPLSGLARVGGPLLLVAAVALIGAGLATAGTPLPLRPASRHLALGPPAAGLTALALVALGAGLAWLAPGRRAAPRRHRPLRSSRVAEDGVSVRSKCQLAASSPPPGASRPASRPPSASSCGPRTPSRCPAGSSARKAGRLAGLALRLHTTVLAGVTVPVGASRFLNELVAWGPSGRIIGTVEKAHPVPFGEYVPLRSIFSRVASLAGVPRDVIAGRNDGELMTPTGRLALLNSFEAFFADRASSGVRAGGELLVVETNTASYSTDVIPAEELAASRLQAVAEGRDLVQAATTGYSAVIDPDGTVTMRSRLGPADLLRATVSRCGRA